ncbi:hypothetical protein, partial [Nocardia abscessus]|uniref:hypothetical protein n=1 Tax=Nocardia abscessus TaxID=120957 RepID=UPI003CC7DCA3
HGYLLTVPAAQPEQLVRLGRSGYHLLVAAHALRPRGGQHAPAGDLPARTQLRAPPRPPPPPFVSSALGAAVMPPVCSPVRAR